MADIEVFGGGIFGLTIAYTLLKRGMRVRLIEKRRIAAGSSGGVVGALAPHTPDSWNAKKQFQFESLIETGPFWAEVDRVSGLSSGYGRIGRVTPIVDDRGLDLARARVAEADLRWQGLARWSVVPDRSWRDWAGPSPTGFLVHDTLSARISPKDACQSLAGAIALLGGEIVEGADKGRGADATVLATGYEGLETLSDDLGRTIGKGVKGQGLLVAHDAGGLPQLYADGLHIIPHEGGTVAIGSTSETDWSGADQVDEQLDGLHETAIRLVPALERARVLTRWAGVRPRGRRRAPILGAHPGQANCFVANGGFKIGFGVAVKAAEVMADLILTGTADIPEAFGVEANLR